MMFSQTTLEPPTMEALRKSARILVIDDHAFPAQRTFTRDGYHFERWPEVKNLSQLTDGHWQVILLDVQGVGLNESPDKQGIGILEHIKRTNPAQAVVIYSAQKQAITASEQLVLADAILDKGISYVDYKVVVDRLLLNSATPGYFISAMNRELGENATLAPKAVSKALRAFRRGDTGALRGYFEKTLPAQAQIDTLVKIIAVGIQAIALFAK
jgi:DNA-binding NarL/FixJ family response regulator